MMKPLIKRLTAALLCMGMLVLLAPQAMASDPEDTIADLNDRI